MTWDVHSNNSRPSHIKYIFVKHTPPQAHKICTEALQWPRLAGYWIKFMSRNVNFSKYCKDQQLAQKDLLEYKHRQHCLTGPSARGCTGPRFRAVWHAEERITVSCGDGRGGGQLTPAGKLICMRLGAGPDGALLRACSAGYRLHNWWNMIIMQAGVGLAGWSSSQGAGPGRALGSVAERNGERVGERERQRLKPGAEIFGRSCLWIDVPLRPQWHRQWWPVCLCVVSIMNI